MGLFDFIGQSITKAVSTATRTMTSGVIGMGQGYVSRAISQGASSLVGRASTALRSGTFLDPLINQTLYSTAGSLFGDVTTMTQDVLTGSLNKYANQTANYPYAAQLRTTPGLSNQVGRYVFGSVQTKEISTTFQPEYSGYNTDIQGSVPTEYLVIMHSERGNQFVYGVMQSGFVMGANSKWNPLVPPKVSEIINIGTQILAGKALAGKWASRRIWTGTSPLSLQVNLQFNAVNDEFREVVLPCLRLQQMALPSTPNKGWQGTVGNYLPLMSPPGPSPFQEVEEGKRWATGGQTVGYENLFLGKGNKIDIRIGKYLSFDNVIISQVGVTYANKMAASGYPIQAEAQITFETYQMMTREELAVAHGLNE